MLDLAHTDHQILNVSNFEDLISNTYSGDINAICWTRQLKGDFSEIINQVVSEENIVELNPEELLELELSQEGQIAREILLKDLQTLKAHGAAPILNVINSYERDDSYSFFPTDVYSFHVDRSPVPTDTFLCTYYGETSDILPNKLAKQKVLVPEIRTKLKKLYNGVEEDFESFLKENFFDLHYQSIPGANPISLGLGHLYRLAIDHPESQVPPCVHRAPIEKNGVKRLLLIC